MLPRQGTAADNSTCDSTCIIIISVVAALVVIGVGIVALVMHQKAKALRQPSAPIIELHSAMPVQGVPQMAPAFDPDTGRPLAPSVSSSAGGSMRFDPDTGQPLPKFDGETGLANY